MNALRNFQGNLMSRSFSDFRLSPDRKKIQISVTLINHKNNCSKILKYAYIVMKLYQIPHFL